MSDFDSLFDEVKSSSTSKAAPPPAKETAASKSEFDDLFDEVSTTQPSPEPVSEGETSPAEEPGFLRKAANLFSKGASTLKGQASERLDPKIAKEIGTTAAIAADESLLGAPSYLADKVLGTDLVNQKQQFVEEHPVAGTAAQIAGVANPIGPGALAAKGAAKLTQGLSGLAKVGASAATMGSLGAAEAAAREKLANRSNEEAAKMAKTTGLVAGGADAALSTLGAAGKAAKGAFNWVAKKVVGKGGQEFLGNPELVAATQKARQELPLLESKVGSLRVQQGDEALKTADSITNEINKQYNDTSTLYDSVFKSPEAAVKTSADELNTVDALASKALYNSDGTLKVSNSPAVFDLQNTIKDFNNRVKNNSELTVGQKLEEIKQLRTRVGQYLEDARNTPGGSSVTKDVFQTLRNDLTDLLENTAAKELPEAQAQTLLEAGANFKRLNQIEDQFTDKIKGRFGASNDSYVDATKLENAVKNPTEIARERIRSQAQTLGGQGGQDLNTLVNTAEDVSKTAASQKAATALNDKAKVAAQLSPLNKYNPLSSSVIKLDPLTDPVNIAGVVNKFNDITNNVSAKVKPLLQFAKQQNVPITYQFLRDNTPEADKVAKELRDQGIVIVDEQQSQGLNDSQINAGLKNELNRVISANPKGITELNLKAILRRYPNENYDQILKELKSRNAMK